ncbi:MAG: MarR family transcriptional regulator [Nitrospirota bacterium]
MSGKCCCSEENSNMCDDMEAVVSLIDKLNKKFFKAQNEVISKSGMTPQQYYLLRLLWENDSIPLHKLASTSCCSKSTITGIVDTMEKNGFVFRDRTSSDRRVILLKLTEKGKSLKGKFPEIDEMFSKCCSGGLTPEEAKQLRGFLEKLNMMAVVY